MAAPGSFAAKKDKILQQLGVPDAEYSDASPKGSVDRNITELVAELNALDGFVTTSSCGGRVAVYLEGPSKSSKSTDVTGLTSSTGGKGGGQWLFSSHDLVDTSDIETTSGSLYNRLGLPQDGSLQFPSDDEEPRFIHFKFEPMILHISTSSAENAQIALTAAMEAGFRESGISGLGTPSRQKGPSTPMVAVRTNGMSFDSIIGYMSADGRIHPMVSEPYLKTIVKIANDRFKTNEERKDRFRAMLLARVEASSKSKTKRKGRPPRPNDDMITNRSPATSTPNTDKDSTSTLDNHEPDLSGMFSVE